MGRRGPAPQPAAVLRMRGSWRAGPRARRTADAVAGLPSVPDWLPESLRSEHHRLGGLLLDMRVLTLADGDALAHMVLALHQWREARAMVEQTGAVIDRPSGPSPSPWCTVEQKYYDRWLRLALQFGLTPSSRTSLGATPAKPDDAATILGLA